jgi:prophage antirepressor-like protein
MEDKLVVFNNKSIRRIWFEDDWWFSVVDIVFALTDSNDAKDYWYRMKDRILLEEGSELSTICRQFKLRAIDGKNRLTDCSNTEGVFRIIQSIPSPKAEPFKRWLAKVGKEISKNEKPDNIIKHKRVAKRGGKVAGNAREQTENEIGKTVISKQNYLRTRGLISEKNKS